MTGTRQRFFVAAVILSGSLGLMGLDCGGGPGGKVTCPSASAAIGIPCSNGTIPDAYASTRLALKLTMAKALLDQTQQAIVVVRSLPDGGDVCGDLWAPDFSRTIQGAGVVPKTGPTAFATDRKIVTPKENGEYGVLVYAVDYQSDLLCESDEWCPADDAGVAMTCKTLVGAVKVCTNAASAIPFSAGCSKAAIDHAATNTVPVTMSARP